MVEMQYDFSRVDMQDVFKDINARCAFYRVDTAFGTFTTCVYIFDGVRRMGLSTACTKESTKKCI